MPGSFSRAFDTDFDLTYSAEVLADNPIAYWRLGDASGLTAVDSSGNGHDGTYTNGPTLGAASLLTDPDTAVSFDGSNDYIDLTNNAALRVSTAWTLEAWIKIASGETISGTIMTNQYDGGTVRWTLDCFDGTNHGLKPAVLFYNGGWVKAQSASDISVNAVHHLVGTWDGTTLKIYVDGSLAASNAPGISVATTNTSTNYIGSRWDNSGDGQKFKGIIDDVALYGTALSAARVLAHYTAGTAGGSTTATPSATAGVGAVPAPAASGTAKATPSATAGVGAIPAPTAKGNGTSQPSIIAISQEAINAAIAVNGSGGTNEAIGQAFTTVGAIELESVELRLQSAGSPTDDLVLELVSGSITGSVVTSVRRPIADIVALAGSSDWFAFTLRASLSSTTQYWLRLSRVGGRDATNALSWRRSNTDAYPSNSRYTEDSGVWSANAATDQAFRIYSAVATAGTGAVPAATAVGATASTATPTAVAGVGSVPAPTTSGQAKAVPSATAGTGSVPSPTATGGVSATTTPARVIGTGAVPSPTVMGTAKAVPSVVAGVATVPAPTITISPIVSPDVVEGVATVPHVHGTGAGTGGGGGTAGGGTDFWTISILSGDPPVESVGGSTATPATVRGFATIEATQIPAPPPTRTTVFRERNWWETPLPSGAPIHSSSATWLAALDALDSSEGNHMYAGHGHISLNIPDPGGQFDAPIFRVNGGNTSYEIWSMGTGTPKVPLRWAPAAQGGTGEGLRIPEYAKTNYWIKPSNNTIGPNQNDSPIQILDTARGYVGWLSDTYWNKDTNRWECWKGRPAGLNNPPLIKDFSGGTNIFYFDSYGIDSGDFNETTISTPSFWPSALVGSGVHPSVYQDEARNQGTGRGNNPYFRVVNYDDFIASGGLTHVCEVYLTATGDNGYFPMKGFETGRGGSIPEGTRMRIKASFSDSDLSNELTAAGLTGSRHAQALLFAKGFRDYGVYVGDNSGSNSRVKLEDKTQASSGGTNPWVIQTNDLQTFGWNDWEIIAGNYDPA